jgi:hypothetical protein
VTQPANGRRPINTIRWWWVLLAAALTALATWGATWWLLSVAGHSADLRVQAIKAGLTVAAGTGGAAALLLATRRQWLHERDQAHREETDAANQVHQVRLAAITELDAIERRITDLYTKAVDQLGSEKAPVRLGGLYALERLAQDNPNHRQTIVNVICAYLRMPYTLNGSDELKGTTPEPAARITYANARQELQVRLTAQRILAAHLKPDDENMSQVGTGHHKSGNFQFWNSISIDLTGATLISFDLQGCAIVSIDCSEATFAEGATFAQATFAADADFSEAKFYPNKRGIGDPAVDFSGVTFSGKADFGNARFTGTTYFRGAVFAGEAFLCGYFSHVDFAKSVFKKDAHLTASFAEEAFFTM